LEVAWLLTDGRFGLCVRSAKVVEFGHLLEIGHRQPAAKDAQSVEIA